METIKVQERYVSCEGEGGAIGHPKIYLNIGEEGSISCPYCSRRYLLESE